MYIISKCSYTFKCSEVGKKTTGRKKRFLFRWRNHRFLHLIVPSAPTESSTFKTLNNRCTYFLLSEIF